MVDPLPVDFYVSAISLDRHHNPLAYPAPFTYDPVTLDSFLDNAWHDAVQLPSLCDVALFACKRLVYRTAINLSLAVFASSIGFAGAWFYFKDIPLRQPSSILFEYSTPEPIRTLMQRNTLPPLETHFPYPVHRPKYYFISHGTGHAAHAASVKSIRMDGLVATDMVELPIETPSVKVTVSPPVFQQTPTPAQRPIPSPAPTPHKWDDY